MTNEEMRHLVDSCTYKPGWHIMLIDSDDRPYIQIAVGIESDSTLCSCARDGSRIAWQSGKRYLSQHMCRQEVVGAVFALIKDAEMHEAHEWFRYRGASIFNPHLDPEMLHLVATSAASFNVRENAMSMKESEV